MQIQRVFFGSQQGKSNCVNSVRNVSHLVPSRLSLPQTKLYQPCSVNKVTTINFPVNFNFISIFAERSILREFVLLPFPRNVFCHKSAAPNGSEMRVERDIRQKCYHKRRKMYKGGINLQFAYLRTCHIVVVLRLICLQKNFLFVRFFWWKSHRRKKMRQQGNVESILWQWEKFGKTGNKEFFPV